MSTSIPSQDVSRQPSGPTCHCRHAQRPTDAKPQVAMVGQPRESCQPPCGAPVLLSRGTDRCRQAPQGPQESLSQAHKCHLPSPAARLPVCRKTNSNCSFLSVNYKQAEVLEIKLHFIFF